MRHHQALCQGWNFMRAHGRGGSLTAVVMILAILNILGGSYKARAAAPRPSFEHCRYGLTPAQVEAKADELLSRMTTDEKIKLLSGNPLAMGTQAIRRLVLCHMIHMRDASCGIGDWARSTGYPASVCLAATWNAKLAYKEGVAIAHDALARRVNIVLGPGMNVEREPQDGRNFEFLGEDPFLTSVMAVQWIRGLQSRGVAACAKHFAGYEDGLDTSIDSIMSRRTLEELYLPPFRAAVRQGHVWSIMCAYYKINGTYCSRNKMLLTDILRRHWGFKGVLMSDWGANHACVRSLNAGLDLEMPQAGYYSQSNIRKALSNGSVSMATINTHVRRILRMIIGMGFLKHHHHPDYNIPLDDPANAAIAMRVAAEGTVLLKNKHHIMPLHRTELKRIVVWGPMASEPITSGGGSGYVHPISGMVSMLNAIAKAAGPDVNVQYVATPLCVYSPSNQTIQDDLREFWGKGNLLTRNGHPGISAEFFNNESLAGPPVATFVTSRISYNWGTAKPAPLVTQVAFSALWRGIIKPDVTGAYKFVSSSCSRVYLNGHEIINNFARWGQNPVWPKTDVLWLHAGKSYRLRVEYFRANPLAQMEFGYKLVSRGRFFSDANRKRIQRANVVIACVGFGPKKEGETVDRGYHLWGLQDRILQHVAKLNPHTIVVVNAGAGIGMASWIHKVAGLVYAWYPGENGNTAVAGIMFGKIDPSGRLPDTFSRHWRDEPAYGHFPAVNNVIDFTSGIYTGYRWYNKKHIQPLYPFGFGLSYTTFAMHHLQVTSTGTGKHRTYEVTAQVTNTGNMAGAEVAQLYIHPLVDRKNRCVQTLKGFARVNLQPGQSKTVRMKLDWRNFAYYDTANHDWQVPPGKYEIAVGSSSADEPLHKIVRW